MVNNNALRAAVALFALTLSVGGVISGCGPKPVAPTKPAPAPPPVAQEPPLSDHPKTVRIYTVAQGSEGDANDLVATTVRLDDSQQPARTALNALIDAKNSPLPKGTAVQGIAIADGLATVDFSSQFKDNFHGSDTEEAQALNSILMTLGQFKSIQRVQITVAGKTVDSLGGHLEISEPLDVITPSAVRQARDSHDSTQN